MLQITKLNFTPTHFQEFLLERMLDEIICCVPHQDASREYLTAIGKILNEIYLIQIWSDDYAFEDVHIVQLAPALVDELLDALHPKW